MNVLFRDGKKNKQPIYSAVDTGLNKSWYTYVVHCHIATKKRTKNDKDVR